MGWELGLWRAPCLALFLLPSFWRKTSWLRSRGPSGAEDPCGGQVPRAVPVPVPTRFPRQSRTCGRKQCTGDGLAQASSVIRTGSGALALRGMVKRVTIVDGEALGPRSPEILPP